MPLPTIDRPQFELIVPSTGKKTPYVPFTVKEEKILLIAQQSKESAQIILAIKQIISNCVPGVKISELATFDLEYIMIQLRAKSVNDVVDLKINDPDTDEEIELSIDLNAIDIKRFDNHSNRIELSDNMYLFMNYPTIDMMNMVDSSIDSKELKRDAMFDVMIKCMYQVTKGEEVWLFSDFSDEEKNVFVENMSLANMKSIKDFYSTMPVLRYEQEYTRKDGTKKTFVVQGMETIFL